MDETLLLYTLQDIADQLRVHLMVKPLDDIVENAVKDIEELIDQFEED